MYYRRCKIRANSAPLSSPFVGIYCLPLPTYMYPFLAKWLIQRPIYRPYPLQNQALWRVRKRSIATHRATASIGTLGPMACGPWCEQYKRRIWTYIGRWAKLYRSASWPIWDCCGRVLPSIYYYAKASHAQLPDVPLRSDTQALHLIVSIPLILQREKWHSREEKAPSRSGILLSMHVVLKTRHVNPNIHVRRY